MKDSDTIMLHLIWQTWGKNLESPMIWHLSFFCTCFKLCILQHSDFCSSLMKFNPSALSCCSGSTGHVKAFQCLGWNWELHYISHVHAWSQLLPPPFPPRNSELPTTLPPWNPWYELTEFLRFWSSDSKLSGTGNAAMPWYSEGCRQACSMYSTVTELWLSKSQHFYRVWVSLCSLH